MQRNRPKRKLNCFNFFNFRFALPRKPKPCGKIFLHTFLISKKYVPARHEGEGTDSNTAINGIGNPIERVEHRRSNKSRRTGCPPEDKTIMFFICLQ